MHTVTTRLHQRTCSEFELRCGRRRAVQLDHHFDRHSPVTEAVPSSICAGWGFSFGTASLDLGIPLDDCLRRECDAPLVSGSRTRNSDRCQSEFEPQGR